MHSNVQDRKDGGRGPIDWIRANLELRSSSSTEFIYDHMESQSGLALPVIHLPFDGTQRGHFVDRAQIMDFAIATGGGRVLDFGPGDGWPSLLMAPMVDQVIGVEGCWQRVDTCSENKRKLGLTNVNFVHVVPGERLPFPDKSFDAVTAASSIEQTDDPKATLAELHRVLKPGGRLRMHYESLGLYRSRQEQDTWLIEIESSARLVIYDRHIDQEYVDNYGLVFDLTRDEALEIIAPDGAATTYAALTPEVLGTLSERLREAAIWTTRHPSCSTWLQWMKEAGFNSALPTYGGGWFAKRLFDRLDLSQRCGQMEAVDRMLRPLVEVVVTMAAPSGSQPGQWDHWITAVK